MTGGADGVDVNAVVSYNLRALRRRRGWTQRQVAEHLGRFTGHQLPQASISAMERGFDGPRRRRFDAHELYLLSVVFDVPLVYFFLPPPDAHPTTLADTGAPLGALAGAFLGQGAQLEAVDQRLGAVGDDAGADVVAVGDGDDAGDGADAAVGVLGLLFEATDGAGTWPDHYRRWRAEGLARLQAVYGDGLVEAVELVARFVADLAALGPVACLCAAEKER